MLNKQTRIINLLIKSVRWFNYYRKITNYRFIDLQNASLERSNLEGVCLQNASLENANLENANLRWSNLKCSSLENANLENANLKSSCLESANLEYSILKGANLKGANLEYANLENANLDYSSLHLSCKTLKAEFDEKHLIQFLYHVAMPYQTNPEIVKDSDLKELLESDLFKKVVNKTHLIEKHNCKIYEGSQNVY